MVAMQVEQFLPEIYSMYLGDILYVLSTCNF